MSNQEILKEYNFSFNKQFGQNFIFDGNLLSAIVSDAGVDGDDVLEIGAGAGTLTKKICEKANKVVSYEIDKNLTELLKNIEKNTKNLKIIIQDALKTPIEEIEKDFEGKYKVVANLPYYITSPLIFKFLEETDRAESITVMVQKEVGERFSAKPMTKDYGIASVMAQIYADIEIVRIVKKEMFHPMPKVDSALIKLTRKPEVDVDKNKLRKFVQTAFSMRRKTLQNNLKALNISKDVLEQTLNKIGKSISIRAEELSLDDFIFLSKNLEF